MRLRWLVLGLALPLHAAVIGMSTAAPPLTEARIRAELPAAQQAPWLAYLKRSQEQMARDKAALAAERAGMAEVPRLPAQGNSAHAIRLHEAAAWYHSDDARRLADTIVSFQTPAGGWSKNLRMDAPRAKGQSYATANLAPVRSPGEDFDRAADETWHYVGTLDNDATNTELHFLAEMSAAWPGKDGDAYRASALRGLEYLLAAQYPNGGWPQIWPLEGGYHDAITFNDDAVTESAEVLQAAGRGEAFMVLPSEAEENLEAGKVVSREAIQAAAAEDWSFVPPALRARANTAVARALDCILRAQVRVPGAGGKGSVLTVWPQQSDMLTLRPVAARNFEPAALSGGESASVMLYLMGLQNPSAEVVRSVNAAAAWFESHEIRGYRWSGGRGTPGGRKLTAEPGAGPIWARYYSIETGKPIFGDRDRTIHDDVAEISLERRNGYGWYGEEPARALAVYADWRKRHRS